MNFAALSAAPPVVLAHAACAAVSLASGTVVLMLPKGTPRHRRLGRVFFFAMMLTALSSFALPFLPHGHFSWIHLLSVLTLSTLPSAILHRRRGNIAAHAKVMIMNYLGLLIAFGFALEPTRLAGSVLFGA